MKLMVLKDKMGEVIRVFRCETEKIFLVYRPNIGRLDFCSSPQFFEKDSIILVDEWHVNKINKQEIPLMGGFLTAYNEVEKLRAELPRPHFDNKSFQLAFGWTAGAYLTLILGLYTLSYFKPVEEQMISQIQQVVKIIKPPAVIKPEKIVIGSSEVFLRNAKEKPAKKTVKKSLKKMGALSVLGSLSKGKQRGGLNLGANKVSAGPGFRAIASNSGSGGVQSQLYSQGMIASALGTGGNVRGGGGHGTKGTESGGGSAGYGELSLIGSGGTEDLSSSSVLSDQGGSFDFSVIDREIVKHAGAVRKCYDIALKTEPDIKGLFNIRFGINTAGKVNFSRVRADSPVQSQAINSCILGIVNKIQFPIQLTANIVIDYSFDLSVLETEGGE
ncbi:MAG: AgmX/PglI C-terminal domain-containing protein [Oligoflexia bacterium]|nr:AgmX/PglI C-terminal domain-containing protein [Oligoflexia bacterium]